MFKSRINKISYVRLILAFMAAATIIYCLTPAINQLFGLGTGDIGITVVGANDVNGGSEIWVASIDMAYDLGAATEKEVVNGECEYRLASDWGYGYNFLISYGNNIGTKLIIKNYDLGTREISLYKNAVGGIVEVS